MSDQVQCPNCGGFRTQTISKNSIHAPGGARAPTLGVKLGRMGCVLFTAIASLYLTLLMCVEITFGRGLGPASEEIVIPFSVALFGVPLVVALLVGVAMWRRVMPLPMHVQGPVIGTMYYYDCYLCGYRWSWRTGTPKPEIHVRPDLIAKGAQRLEEEEAAFQDAAAHYFAEEALKRAGYRQ